MTKELRLTPFIAKHDLLVKIRKAEDFLKNKYQLKVSVFFKGRAITKTEAGYQVITELSDAVSKWGRVHIPPKLDGKRLTCLIVPKK